MKKIKILSLFVCLIALLAACEDEDITPSYGARTVLVYIAGNNSLGQSDFDSKDVSEMIEGMKGTGGQQTTCWFILLVIRRLPS